MTNEPNRLKKVWQAIRRRYDNLPKETKENIVFILNYSLNSVFISVFVYLVMSLWLKQSFIRFIGTYICVVIFSIYFEHYYVWLRSKWKENLL